jgi:ubiquitin carboxyl-terminal hydrolase 16/45
MKYRTVSNQLINNRQNQDIGESYLNKLLEAEKAQKLLEQQQQQQQQQQQVLKNTGTKLNSSNMKDTHKNSNSISGLNNLGNTCFFNSVLQNIAQAPYLEELLSENLKSNDIQFNIRHNDDYDSELTDFEEDSHFCLKKSNTHDEENPKETSSMSQSDFNNNSTRRDSASGQSHRSICLKELNLVLNESPGPLTRTLHDLIKSMYSSSSTVNPSAFHSAFCRKIPHFKGFQQHDSHELLRNLLDAVKSEELKRRQAAILGQFKLNTSKGVDDLTKRIIKRYGRLSSYTFVDKLFGGHLLSSIVCEDCKNCTQRVEPFLDLSLPIVDEQSRSAAGVSLANDDLERSGARFKKDNKRGSYVVSGKKGRRARDNNFGDDTTEIVDPKENNMSKNMSKKQKKQLVKKSKKSKGKYNSNPDEIEENPEASEPNDSVSITIKKEIEPEETQSNLDPEENIQKSAVSAINEQEKETAEADTEINQKLENLDLNSTETPCEFLTSPPLPEDLNESIESNNSELSDNDNDNDTDNAENKFKLECMISLSTDKANNAAEKGVASLESCLNNFTSIETLADKINCEKCTKKLNGNVYGGQAKPETKNQSKKQQNPSKVYTRAIKQYLICDLPKVLTIHLKRFQQHGFRLEKSNKHVSFPLVLNMAPFASKMCINTCGKNGESILYSLYGIVEHSGKLNCGHYTAYVKSRNKSSLSNFLGNRRLCRLKREMKGLSVTRDDSDEQEENDSYSETASNVAVGQEEKWFYISDAHVSEVSVAKVLKVQAYILFYERIK